MKIKPLLNVAALTFGLLAAGLVTANAQTSFRPGRDGGEYSGYEQARAVLDTLGLAHSNPERWHPLPEARQIVDQLAANGDVRDDALKNSWEEVGRMTQAIEAAFENCQVSGVERINELVGRMRRLGEELRARASEIAEIREGVIELYNTDLDLFMENISDKPDVRREAENFRNSNILADVLNVANEIIGGAGQASRAAALDFLGVVGVTIAVADGAVMSYEAFVAYNRLPHILEKHEMIAWLNALIPQYREVIQAINAIITRTYESMQQRCPCLVERMVPRGQPINVNPDSDRNRLNTLLDRREVLRERAARGEEVGITLGDVELQIGELTRRITSRSETDRARRAWYEQVDDNTETRRRYDAYRRARLDGNSTPRQPSRTRPERRLNIEVVPNN